MTVVILPFELADDINSILADIPHYVRDSNPMYIKRAKFVREALITSITKQQLRIFKYEPSNP